MASGRTSAFRLPVGVDRIPWPAADDPVFRDASRLWLRASELERHSGLNWRSADTVTLWQGHSTRDQCPGLSNDGKLLASGSTDLTARLWDATQQASRKECLLQKMEARSHSLSAPTTRRWRLAVLNGQLKLWNVAARTEIATLHSHLSIVLRRGVSADGRTSLAPATTVRRECGKRPRSRRSRFPLKMTVTLAGFFFEKEICAYFQALSGLSRQRGGASMGCNHRPRRAADNSNIPECSPPSWNASDLAPSALADARSGAGSAFTPQSQSTNSIGHRKFRILNRRNGKITQRRIPGLIVATTGARKFPLPQQR